MSCKMILLVQPSSAAAECVLYLEQFLFKTGVFLGGLHPTITHVARQLSKDITLIVYQAILFLVVQQKNYVSWLA